MLIFLLPCVWSKLENISIGSLKVSVIVPVFNRESKISICLNSIVEQTLKEIEIICVDDGSTDESLQFLNAFAEKDGRIRVFHQENCGPACARNTGIFYARGEYLGFVDSDDWVESALYETAYERAKDGDIDVVEFNMFRGTNVPRIGKFFEKRVLRGMEAARNFVFVEGFKGVPEIFSRIYRTTLIKGNGIMFDTMVAFGLDDLIFNLDLIPFVKSVAFVSTSFYHYNPGESGLCRNYKKSDWKSAGMVALLRLEKIKKCQECLTRKEFKRMEEDFKLFGEERKTKKEKTRSKVVKKVRKFTKQKMKARRF